MRKLVSFALAGATALALIGAAVPASAGDYCQQEPNPPVYLCPPVIHADVRASAGDVLSATWENSGEPALVVVTVQRRAHGIGATGSQPQTVFATILASQSSPFTYTFAAPPMGRNGWRVVALIYNCGDPDVETVTLTNTTTGDVDTTATK